MTALEIFPPINATLNAASAILLLTGWRLIRAMRIRAHAYVMLTALLTSTIFLACYLTFHTLKALAGSPLTRFPPGSIRPFYLALLLSHTVLAIAILPMIALTIWRAWRRDWPNHRRIARPTFWLWLYVSVTGVVVYFMLYHLAPMLAKT